MKKRQHNWEKLNERIREKVFSIFCLKMQNLTLSNFGGVKRKTAEIEGEVKTDLYLEKIASRNENSWKTMC